MAEPKIQVPSSPAPTTTLCWKTPGLPPYNRGFNPMAHCDRQVGHEGLCSWELEGTLRKVQDVRAKLEEEIQTLDMLVRSHDAS